MTNATAPTKARPRTWWSDFGDICGWTTFFLVLTTLLLLYRFGGVARLAGYLRGDIVVAEPTFIDFGYVAPGTMASRPVSLVNLTGRPVTILGGTTDCVFRVQGGLPVALGPGETKSLNLQVFAPARPSDFAHTFLLYTGDTGRPARVSIRGKFERTTAEPPLAGD